MNPMLLCDAYKLGHMEQYPSGTTMVYSNFTARSFKHMNSVYPVEKMVFFGLAGVLSEMKEIWDTNFFKKPYSEVEKDFRTKIGHFVSPNWPGYENFKQLHALGFLPLEVRAIKEGSRVKPGVPVLTIHNTRPEFFWLTNYVETYLSAELWKMSTSATIAYAYRQILEKYAELTGSPKEFIDWQGHDFSYRGLSGSQDAAKSGAAHLTSFLGTDTLPAIDFLHKHYYGDQTFCGSSVPATEHSVMCAGGKDTELETYRRLITEIYPSGIVSIVSDTWDFWNAVTNIASELKEEIISRKPDALGFAKVVFRPDSGNPLFVICGNPEAPEGSPEYKGAVQCLWEIFGGTTTSTGHKLLSQNVGLIYGDSITPQLCEEILKTLHSKGFASANLVFGIGSYTYQYNTRDTLGFAMKATLIERNGVRIPIFKDPVTDTSKTKKSAKGLLAVQDQDGELVLLDNLDERPDNDQLQTVFIDGTLVTESIELIRTRLR